VFFLLKMFEIIFYALLGSLSGIVTGLIPGIGPAQLLAIAYVALLALDPLQLAVFYVGLITTSQYLDSVPATYFGVPGEVSAVPASYEGPRLMSRGLGQQSIRMTAIGRVIASLVAVALGVALLSVILQSTWVFKNNVQLALLMMAVIGVAVTSQCNWWRTAIAMTLGYAVGKVGFDYTINRDIMTFGIPQLQEGLPLLAVLMGIYVIPLLLMELVKSIRLEASAVPQQTQQIEIGPYVPTILRSSVLGWFLGLIPGLSYILSATGCYAYEKWRRIRQKLYQPGDMHSMIAAETGNTSGAFSTLIPLMIFGIPITISEVILYNLMLTTGADFSRGTFLMANYDWLLFSFLLANVLGLIFCWPLAMRMAGWVSKINLRVSWIAIITVVSLCVIWQGYYNQMLLLYLIVFAIMILIGLTCIRYKIDLLPVLFVFLLQSNIDQAVFNLWQIYFKG
jgi:putative tricarboxylic transport membrane protein